jgi:type VI secretion system protein ImpC
MLERLLGRPHTEPRGRAKERPLGPPTRDITQLIRHLVAPYIVPEADPFQAQYVAAVDEAISREMRGLLHHPTFQALEANWRALNWLVTSLETGEDLKLYVLDVSKEELLATFEAAGSDLEQWSLYRLLVEKERKTPGGEPWSVLVGCYDFGATTRDLRLLAALGALASQAGGPVLAAAEPTLLGCRSLIECADPRNGGPMDENAERAWQALRESAFAPWIGLSMPRILLRLPYGERTDATERFAFEELAQQPDHEAFLWGNPAFACALLIAQAFEASGWSMEPGDRLDVEDLPAYTYEEDGEPRMLPCAEVFLTERAAEAILNRGIMPLVSYRNRNAVRLMRFQSIARPAKPVTGQWV